MAEEAGTLRPLRIREALRDSMVGLVRARTASGLRNLPEMTVRLGVSALVLVAAPAAARTGLVHWAVWPAHWIEPLVLSLLPAAAIPKLAGPRRPLDSRRRWRIVLVQIWAAGVVLSPHLAAGGALSLGFNLRSLFTGAELLVTGGIDLSAHEAARLATSALAAGIGVAILAYQSMAALQWLGDRLADRAPAKPARTLSDAAWAGRDDVRRRFAATGGIILGEQTEPRPRGQGEFDPADRKTWRRQGQGPLIALDPARGNGHSLVFSGSGSFKTAGIVIPNALTFDGPLIVIDPKGEIYRLTAGVRRARGRKPWLITAESGLDPFKLLTTLSPNDGTVFSDIAGFMVTTTGEDRSDAAAFFHKKALRTLTSLFGHLHHEGTHPNIPVAANRLLAGSPGVIRAEFLAAAERYGAHAAAIQASGSRRAPSPGKGGRRTRDPGANRQDRRGSGREPGPVPDFDFITVGLSELAHTEDRQFSSIVATVANGLEWAGQAATRGYLVSPCQDGRDLLDRVLDPDTDIYVQIPTAVAEKAPEIPRTLIGSLVRAIRDSTPISDPEADPVHRLFIIDEARALRRMDFLAAVRDEARAYGVHLMQIFQSWQQLLECYGPHGAGAWENSVDAMVIGPVQNAVQAQALSRMIGRKTVTTASESRQRSHQLFMPFSGSAGSSESTQLRETELIQPSELRQLPPEAAIILATGTAPILASKAIWFTRDDMTRIVDAARRPVSAPESPGSRPPPSPSVIPSLAASGDAPDTKTERNTADARKGPKDPIRVPDSRRDNGGATDSGHEDRGLDRGAASAPGRDGVRSDRPSNVADAENTRERPAPARNCKDAEPSHAERSRTAGSETTTGRSDESASDSNPVAPPPLDTHAVSGSEPDPDPVESREAGRPVPGPDGPDVDESRLAPSQPGSPKSDVETADPRESSATPAPTAVSPGSEQGVAERDAGESSPASGPTHPGTGDIGAGLDDVTDSLPEIPRSNGADPAPGDPPIPGDRAAVATREPDSGDLGRFRAAIGRNTVHDILIAKAVDPEPDSIAARALGQPFLRAPAGTTARVIPPGVLGPGVDAPDIWSIVFIPDDRNGPIHRILLDDTGRITGTAGPYRRGSG
ncbi:MAG: type IV secretory system conjugative DNA transfer family protein [Paracoccaceae bacterium]|nr:type IV secretory system conjugative DNA transfer family protein [Paracoccaceae bacterium]